MPFFGPTREPIPSISQIQVKTSKRQTYRSERPVRASKGVGVVQSNFSGTASICGCTWDAAACPASSHAPAWTNMEGKDFER